MANIRLKVKYRCNDDCVMSGCPSHDAILEYQSTSDAYKFISGFKECFFERGELGAFIKLLCELEERRADAIQISRYLTLYLTSKKKSIL